MGDPVIMTVLLSIICYVGRYVLFVVVESLWMDVMVVKLHFSTSWADQKG